MKSDEIIQKGFFVQREESQNFNRPLSETWMDDQGRVVECFKWDYRPEKMSVLHERYDPETGVRHAEGKPARTQTCLVSGVIFEEIFYFQDEPHREDGDAIIKRNRVSGADIHRSKYISGVEYEVTPKGMFPKVI